MAGIYIHIPFCKTRCIYCDFYSTTHSELKSRYIHALCKELQMRKEYLQGEPVETVYFGGGTPSQLAEEDFREVFETIRKYYGMEHCREITLEANPDDLTEEYTTMLQQLPFNRISMGIQTFDDATLKLLNRRHDAEQAVKAVHHCRRAGFNNISIDLMYGIPEQTVDSFMQSLSFAASRAPEHISLYALKIEDGTPFARRRESLPLPDEDAEYEMYMRAIDYLGTRGYKRYEISNFAKPGYESKHNLKYWHCDEYLGLGASAHSYFGRERFSATRVVRDYIDGIEIIGSDINIIASCDKIRSRESMDEYVMLGMRLDEGVNIRAFDERFGVSFKEKYGVLLDEYIKDGFVECDGENYRFTSNGMFVSNYILSSVLDLGVSDK